MKFNNKKLFNPYDNNFYNTLYSFTEKNDIYKVSLYNYPFGEYNSFEPFIDAKTHKYHYEVLFKKYVDNVNAVFSSELFIQLDDFKNCKSLVECLCRLNLFYENVINTINDPKKKRLYTQLYWKLRYGIGGVLNHDLYFNLLTNDPMKRKVSDRFTDILLGTFNSWDRIKTYLIDYSVNTIGDGWRFLCVNSENKLSINFSRAQDNPILNGNYPILNIDLWEHSYIFNAINNHINKQSYIEGYFSHLNWKLIENLYNYIIE